VFNVESVDETMINYAAPQNDPWCYGFNWNN
jgi:hypothetical protein